MIKGKVQCKTCKRILSGRKPWRFKYWEVPPHNCNGVHQDYWTLGEKAKTEKEIEDEMLATTCFHCGDPAMPETRGFDPRCERHRDV